MSDMINKMNDDELNNVTGGTAAIELLNNAGAAKAEKADGAVKNQDPKHSIPCSCGCGHTFYIPNRGSNSVKCPYCGTVKHISG